jgi:hypothetical protein
VSVDGRELLDRTSIARCCGGVGLLLDYALAHARLMTAGSGVSLINTPAVYRALL